MANKTDVYGLIFDHGDDSNSIRWFTYEDVSKYLSDDYAGNEFDYIQCNEGEPAAVLHLPEGVTPEQIGIHISKFNG